MRRSLLLAVFACLVGVGAVIWFDVRESATRGPVAGDRDEHSAVPPDLSASRDGGRIDVGAPRPELGRTDAPLPETLEVLAGRLLTPDGTPHVDARATYRLLGPKGPVEQGALTTDGAGSFVLTVRVTQAGAPRSLRVDDEGERGPLAAVVQLPAPQPGARTDVGDLRLDGLKRIASGHVVDDVGRPIAGALVVLQRQGPPGRGSPRVLNVDVALTGSRPQIVFSSAAANAERLALFEELAQISRMREEMVAQTRQLAARQRDAASDPRALERQARSAEASLRAAMEKLEQLQVVRAKRAVERERALRWSDDATLRATTAADGSFELFAFHSVGPFRARAAAEGHRSAVSQEFAFGAAVNLTLPRTASLSGTALLPAWMPAHALEFVLVRPDDSAAVASAAVESDGRDTRFRFDQLESGVRDLVVRLRTVPGKLLRVDGIELSPERPNVDPRLSPVDLTRALYRYQLRALDDGGNPMTDIPSPLLARVQTHDGKFRHIGFPWRKGRAEVFSRSPTMNVTLLCAGHRQREITIGHGRRDVVFQRLHPLELTFPGLREICGPGRKVRVSVVGTTGTGLPSGLSALDQRSGETQSYSRWHLAYSGGAWLGETDTVRVPLIRNGPYQVILRLHEEGVGGDSSHVVSTIQVTLDGSLPQRVTVPFDRAAIEAGIRSLQGRKRK